MYTIEEAAEILRANQTKLLQTVLSGEIISVIKKGDKSQTRYIPDQALSLYAGQQERKYYEAVERRWQNYNKMPEEARQEYNQRKRQQHDTTESTTGEDDQGS